MFDNGGMGTACLDCIIEFFKRTNRAAGDNYICTSLRRGRDTAWPIPRLAPVTKITLLDKSENCPSCYPVMVSGYCHVTRACWTGQRASFIG